jgi:hypothetical protein
VPTLSALRETNAVFAVCPASTPPTGVTAARRQKRGTVLSFRLDQPATVRIAVQRLPPGSARRSPLQARPPGLRRYRHCTRTLKLATLRRSAHVGRNKVPFSGRLRGKALRPGRYRAVFTATDSAGSSAPKGLSFRIVRR